MHELVIVKGEGFSDRAEHLWQSSEICSTPLVRCHWDLLHVTSHHTRDMLPGTSGHTWDLLLAVSLVTHVTPWNHTSHLLGVGLLVKWTICILDSSSIGPSAESLHRNRESWSSRVSEHGQCIIAPDLFVWRTICYGCHWRELLKLRIYQCSKKESSFWCVDTGFTVVFFGLPWLSFKVWSMRKKPHSVWAGSWLCVL